MMNANLPYSFRITCPSTGEVLESSEVFADRTRACRKAAHFAETLTAECRIEILTVSRDGSRAVDLFDEDGNPRFDADWTVTPTNAEEPETVHAYHLTDGTQGFIIGYADTMTEAVKLYDEYLTENSASDCCIWDANHNDVTEQLLMSEEQEEETMISVNSIRATLDTGIYGEYLNDYRDCDAYISDAVSEIADSHTSIYYHDILDFISQHPDSLAEVIDEGLFDPTRGYDLYKHGQAAEFMLIERDIWEHLRDALHLTALDFIQYDLNRDDIPEELAEKINASLDDIELLARMNELTDMIREYFEEV